MYVSNRLMVLFSHKFPQIKTTTSSDLHSERAHQTTDKTVSTCLKIVFEVIYLSVSSCSQKKSHLLITLTAFLCLELLKKTFSARSDRLYNLPWTDRTFVSLHMGKQDLERLTLWRDQTASYFSTIEWRFMS